MSDEEEDFDDEGEGDEELDDDGEGGGEEEEEGNAGTSYLRMIPNWCASG